VEITFLGHASLILSAGGRVVYVDLYSKVADYGALPKADVVLITHEHQDRLDQAALQAIRKETTRAVASAAVAEQVKGATAMENGAVATVGGTPSRRSQPTTSRTNAAPVSPFIPEAAAMGMSSRWPACGSTSPATRRTPRR